MNPWLRALIREFVDEPLELGLTLIVTGLAGMAWWWLSR